MEDHHRKISEDRLFYFDKEEVVVDDFDVAGFVLDIGGGGEGVIGRLKGEQVVAIDRSKRELAEAAAGPLKIVMDATDLQFLDESFGTATAFYTLMYIREIDTLSQVFAEVYRVLAPGGRFLVWDAIVPPRPDQEKDIAVLLLSIRLPAKELETGYGMRWPDKGRDTAYYVALAERAGFQVAQRREKGQQFFLELLKPQVERT